MLRGVLGICISATIALAGCSGDARNGDRPSSEGDCGYDAESLLPAMEAAIPDDATVQAAMEMTGGGQEIAMDATIAHTSAGGEIDMTFRSPEQEFALIVVDERVFFSESISGGGYRELDDSDPAVAELRSQAESMDITSEFAAWNAGLEDVEQAGEEDIDGERTCRYSLVVNSADAAEADREPVAAGMPETITYEVYLDANDRMRRVTFGIGELEAEMNATDWNEPVEIKAPTGTQLQR